MNINKFIQKISSFIQRKYHLIIPTICISLWLFYYLVIKMNFDIIKYYDFEIFYNAGKQIFIDPLQLYNDPDFFFLPSFAVAFAISFSLIPSYISPYLFLALNYLAAVIGVIEFNKILKLRRIEKQFYRFLFLIIISNSFFLYHNFWYNQIKPIVLLIILFIIRRELQFSVEERKKELSYYAVNYGLFIFAIGMTPYFIFFLLIYIFHDIPIKKLFNKENLKKYFIVIIMFVLQNFLFFLFPSLILNFLEGITYPYTYRLFLPLIYLNEWCFPPQNIVQIVTIVFTSILVIVSVLITFNNKLKLIEKFGYFSLIYMFIGLYSYPILTFMVLVPLVLLLFVPYLDYREKGIGFIKNNKTLLIGLVSILLLCLNQRAETFYKYIPLLQEFPFVILVNLRWLILLIIIVLSFLLLRYQKTRKVNIS